MARFSGASITPAADSAAAPAVNAANLVNQVTSAGVASPIWPGAVNPVTYTNPGDLTKSQELTSPLPGQEFSGTIPAQAPGGGYQDTSWETGHDAPMSAWDSAQVQQGIGPGAIVDTHMGGSGAVFAAEHVTPPDIGLLTRRTTFGEAMNLEWGFNPETGERNNAPAGRTNMDQAQYANSDAYDPWTVDYSERPIYNNLAAEAMAYTGMGVYSPSGQLPVITTGNEYAAQTYQAPPDPATTTAIPASAGGIGGGWVLG